MVNEQRIRSRISSNGINWNRKKKGQSREIEKSFSTKLSFQAEPQQIYLAKEVLIIAIGKTVF